MYKPITILVAKVAFVLLMFLVLASCKNDHSKREIKKPVAPQKEAAKIIQSNFQEMIDTNLVKGSILLYDPQLNKYYCNDFEDAKKKTLPASTFKIPNSIIALETSVIKEISDTIKWDGQVQAFKIWEQDMTFAEAYKYSCLPCYRQLTRSQTTASMSEWLKKMEYPDITKNYPSLKKHMQFLSKS